MNVNRNTRTEKRKRGETRRERKRNGEREREMIARGKKEGRKKGTKSTQNLYTLPHNVNEPF